MPNLDPTQIRVAGTGALWKAPLGTAIPTDSTVAWNAAFVHLGYATNGFTITQNLSTVEISAWQTLDTVRVINSALTRQVAFESLESDKQNLSLAWGNATVTNTGVAAGGVVTFTASTITTATAHGFVAGNWVIFSGITGTPGVVAGTPYYVLSAPSTTTMTVSLTAGGSVVAITTGSATGVASSAPYSIALPDAATIGEFILGIDWSDGTSTQRLVLQRAALLSLPAIKFARDDAVRYPLEVRALKPSDGSQAIVIYGNDVAATQ